MSLLIKDVEMPNYCDNCPCCHCDSITWDVLCGAEKRIITNKAINQEWKEPGIKRPSWCPLINVPPHGRLIDADAFLSEMETSLWDWESVNGITAKTVLRQTMTDIRNQPTVLKAEEEG